MLWDLDGTLVTSTALWRAAYDEVVRELGVRLPEGLWPALVGRTIEDSVAVLRDRLGLQERDAPTAWLSVRLVDRAEALVASGTVRVGWRPGAREALALARMHGLPVALVTTTWRRLASKVVTRLDATFDEVVYGDDVTRGKPAPDAYLLAAERLGVDVAEAVAVEDSATGVAAAEAAGLGVLAVPSGPAIPPAAGRTVRASLVGLTRAELDLAATDGRATGRGISRAGR